MAEEKPITSDPDEVELLKDMGIPLTDPNAKKDVDETETPPEEAKTDEVKEDKPAEADAEGDAAGDVGGDRGADGVEPVPAAPDAPEPAGGAEPADGGGDKPAATAPTAQQPVADKPAEPVLSPAAKRLAEVEALILADEYDPYTKAGKELQLEHNKLAAKVEAEPLYAEKRVADAYKPYLKQCPDIKQETMQAAFVKHEKAYATKGYSGEGLNAAATVAMEMELQQIANGQKGAAAAQAAKPAPGAKVAPPVPKTPITPRGAIVAPPKAAPTSMPRRELSDEEELVGTMRKNFPQGMRQTLRG